MTTSKSTRPAIQGGRRLAEPFADVWLRVTVGRSAACIEYAGPVEQLMAAGCITAELAGLRRKGSPRRDADGDRVIIDVRCGGRLMLRTHKPLETACRMPGVAEWIAAERAQEREGERLQAMQRFLESAPAGAALH
jgi:hypothetical protein